MAAMPKAETALLPSCWLAETAVLPAAAADANGAGINVTAMAVASKSEFALFKNLFSISSSSLLDIFLHLHAAASCRIIDILPLNYSIPNSPNTRKKQ